jgi:hypothetical protein
MQRAHILPLTNCAFNKSGDRHVLKSEIFVHFSLEDFTVGLTLNMCVQLYHGLVRSHMQGVEH